MLAGKAIAIAILGIALTASSVGFANYYLQSSLQSQQIAYLKADPSTTTLYSTIISTSVSVYPLTQTTTQFDTLTSTSTRISLSTEVETYSTTSVSTYSTTYTTSKTITQTTSIFPPTNSSYALTYINGTAIQSQAGVQCGYLTLAVDVTYEMHQQIPSGVIQWLQFPQGNLMQPSSQTEFTNQAYFTVDSSYNYGTGFCPNNGAISNATIFVTNSNDYQLSPSTFFVVQND
jgi:hypothetical protein